MTCPSTLATQGKLRRIRSIVDLDYFELLYHPRQGIKIVFSRPSRNQRDFLGAAAITASNAGFGWSWRLNNSG